MAKRGLPIIEGKTKIVFAELDNPADVIMFSKDEITAGNGKRHDIIPGKGAVSNRTTCNVFDLLKRHGIPVAFHRQLSDTEMLAERCQMIPLEVVVRGHAQGSILKREPELTPLQAFYPPRFELYLKTTGKVWKGKELPCDDPLLVFDGIGALLFEPDKPITGQKPFMVIPIDDVINPNLLPNLKKWALQSFRILKKAYFIAGEFQLIDFKIEFGFTLDGRLVIGDVLDAESIRLRRDEQNFDKQPYRDEGFNTEFLSRWKEVMRVTDRFAELHFVE